MQIGVRPDDQTKLYEEIEKLTGWEREQTNKEWIQSATTEQLVMFLAKQKCDGCNDEPYDETHGTCKYCMMKKTEQVREWLNSPHKVKS